MLEINNESEETQQRNLHLIVEFGNERDADAVVKAIKEKTGVNLQFGSRGTRTAPGFNFSVRNLAFFNLTEEMHTIATQILTDRNARIKVPRW